jgi:hypothetical protein
MRRKYPILLGLAVLLMASLAGAQALNRLVAEFQSPGEVATTVGPLLGGTVVYDKTVSIPPGVAYITFSAQADTHTGTALLMSASVTDASGATTICQPHATAGGAAIFGAPWMTLLKLPDSASTNCNDGGGGGGDCHDNTIYFSCCALLTSPPDGNTTRNVLIRMASEDGVNPVFYENSTIYIDRGPNPGGGFCQQVGTGPH